MLVVIIRGDGESQFKEYTDSIAFRESYDIEPVVHYGWNDFAMDPKTWTIRPKPQ